ncbi:HNH endonuclease [Paracoccus aerius]
MAKTKGHGNPNWTHDEIVLALDLYLRLDRNVPSPRSPEIQALSAVLRSMPYHLEAAKQPSFRNPDGVGFKLMNLRQLDSGRGLSNVSKTDRQVWEKYSSQPATVRSLADAISTGMKTILPEEIPEEVEELPEGRLLTAIHVRKERNPKVRKMLLDARRATGLRCEICDLSRPDIKAELEDAIFEAHHIVPLAGARERKTKLSDLSLLCACCHRAIHRAMIIEKSG